MMSALLSQLQQAKNALEDAHIALCGAVTAHAEARRSLECAEASSLTQGVVGKNERERSAWLRLQLCHWYGALHVAEDDLTEARCAFECARLEWDLARYMLRVFEAEGLREAA